MNDVAVITVDRACIHCGYNLHGLTPTDKCPECFTEITLSLRGNLLKDADSDWLDRLRFGTVLKLWNVVVGMAVAALATVLVFTGMPRRQTLPEAKSSNSVCTTVS